MRALRRKNSARLSNLEKTALLRRAESGEVLAQTFLGWAYSKRGDFDEDPEKAECWLRKAASSGELEPRRRLAWFLYDQNRNDAVEVFVSLIQADDFYGHYLMGHCSVNGHCGVKKDRGMAVSHFDRAAELGHLVSRITSLKLRFKVPLLNPKTSKEFFGLVLEAARRRAKNPDDVSIYR